MLSPVTLRAMAISDFGRSIAIVGQRIEPQCRLSEIRCAMFLQCAYAI